MWDIGVNTWVWTSPVTDDRLAALAPRVRDWGFDVIELPVEHPGDWDPHRAADLLAALEFLIGGSTTPGTSPITGAAGKCVDISGASSADGAAVILWTCHGGTNQTWARRSDNTLVSLGKCMNAAGTADGSAVQIATCSGSTAQKWTYESSTRRLRNGASSKCLDAFNGSSADGTRLIIWPCHSGTNQQWSLP